MAWIWIPNLPNILTATPLSGIQELRIRSAADEFMCRHIIMVCWTCEICVPTRAAYRLAPVLRRVNRLTPPARPPCRPTVPRAQRRGQREADPHVDAQRPGGQPHCTNPRLHQLPDTHGATADRGQQSTDHRPARARAWAHPPVERTQPTRPLALKERDLDPEQPACELGGRPGRRLGQLGALQTPVGTRQASACCP